MQSVAFERISIFTLFVLSVGALLFLIGHSLSSASIDVSAHYELISHFFEGTLPDVTMSQYPPISHFFGAQIARFAGSTLLGMNFTALACVTATYLLVLLTMRQTDWRLTLGSATALFLFAVTEDYHVVFGYELVGNYFYAQVFGTCATIGTVFFFSTRPRANWEIVAFPAIAFVFGWLFPLAQINFAGAAIVLWLYQAALDRSLKRLLLSAILAVLCAGSIVFHPQYAFMRMVANNGGDILRLSLPTLALIAAAGIAAALALFCFAASGRSPLKCPILIPALTVATCGPFLLNMFLFTQFGATSHYAVGKHVFGAVTFTVASIILLVSALAYRLIKTERKLPVMWAAPMLAAAIIYLIISPYSRDATRFLAVQSSVKTLVKDRPEIFGKTVARTDLPQTFNLILSLTYLGLPPSLALQDAWNMDLKQSADPIKWVVTDHTEASSCGSAMASDLTLKSAARC